MVQCAAAKHKYYMLAHHAQTELFAEKFADLLETGERIV
jgi:hypothetical protein